jgi:hypothetical protein
VNRSAQERVAETLWLAKATEGTAQEPGKKREDIFFFFHIAAHEHMAEH